MPAVQGGLVVRKTDERLAHSSDLAQPGYRWVILPIIVLAQISIALAPQGFAPLTPFLKSDFNLSLAQVGLIGTANGIGTGALVILAGWLVDRFGIRYVLLGGQLVVGSAVALTALTQSFEQVLLTLFLAGLGGAVSAPSGTKAVVTWFSARGRATAMGVKQAGVPTAGVLAALILPTVALTSGWRTACALAGAIIIVAGFVVFAFYRDVAQSDGEKTTIDGTWKTIASLLHNRDIMLLSAGATCYVLVQYCFVTYLVLYLRDVHALSLVTAGVLLAIAQGGGGVGRIALGVVSDRFFAGGRKKPLAIVGVVVAALAVALAGIPGGEAIVPLGILAFALGFGAIGWPSLHLSLIAELSGVAKAGTAIGLSVAFLYVGNTIGPPVFGMIVDHTGSYSIAWISQAVISLIGVVFILLTREDRRQI
jgi:MFS transporter, ACS family, hexuronate transporter